MKLLALLSVFAGLVLAQDLTTISKTSSGGITAADTACSAVSCVWIVTPLDTATASIQLSGTFAATVQFEASVGGTAWVSIASVAGPSSSTAAGIFTFNLLGSRFLRARASAYTSGKVQVDIGTSQGGGSSSGSSSFSGCSSDGSNGITCTGAMTASGYSSTATTFQMDILQGTGCPGTATSGKDYTLCFESGVMKKVDGAGVKTTVNALSFTAEDSANKDTDVNLAANSDTRYPSQKAIKAYVLAHAGGVSMFRPPVAVDDTTGWTDYGSATGRTIDTSNTGIVVVTSAAPIGSKNMQGRKMAVTSPFTKIFAILPMLGTSFGQTFDLATAGLFFTDGTKSVTCAMESYSSNGVFVQTFKNTNATTFSAGYAASFPFNDLSTQRAFPRSGLSTISYWKLSDASGTLTCSWSPDGYSWQTVLSQPDTDFLSSVTHVGYFVDGGAAGDKVGMIVRSVE